MAGADFLFVTSYDVADDRRQRLARLLEQKAVPLQESVFEIRAPSAKAMAQAARAWRRLRL